MRADTIGKAMEKLYDFCEQRDLDFVAAKKLIERMANGEMTMVECAEFVTRHLLFREGVKNAKRAQDAAVLRVKAARPRVYDKQGYRLDPGPTRVCKHCDEEKPIEDFPRSNGRVDGSWNRAWTCKPCWKIRYGRSAS